MSCKRNASALFILVMSLCMISLRLKADEVAQATADVEIPIPFASDGEGVSKARKAFLDHDPLVKSNVDNKIVREENILIAVTDLNADKNDEILVYIDDPFYCGQQGCNFQGFSQSEGKLISLTGEMIVPKDLAFAGSTHNGYKDIKVTNSKGKRFIWAYDKSKKEYSPIGGIVIEQKIIQ